MIRITAKNGLMLKGIIVTAVVAVFGAWMFTSLPSPTANAISQGPHSTNKDSHRNRCDGDGHPYIDFSIKVTNINLNVNNGNVTYQVEIKFQKCRNSTSHYAIYGRNFCERLGDYGGAGDGHTDAYDCVKYRGTTNLTCGSGKTNKQCLRAKYHADFDDAGGFLRPATAPGDGAHTITTADLPTLTVPNWNTRKLSSGSHTLNIPGSICQYYKYGTNFGNVRSGNRCIDNANITVSWNVVWNITPSTSMRVNGTQRSGTPASPYDIRIGDQVQWTHTISNSGDPTDRNVAWQTRQAEFDFDTNIDAAHVYPNTGTWTHPRANGASSTVATNTRTISGNDANKRFCQMVENNPNSSSVGGWEGSAWRCVRVEPGYNITTEIDPVQDIFIGSPEFNVTGAVRSTGNLVGNHDVRLSAYRYNNSSIKSSGQLSARTSSAQTPCNVSNLKGGSNAFVECKDESLGNYDGTPNPLMTDNPFDDFDFDAPANGYPLGTTFCFMLSAKDPTRDDDDNNNWYHSALTCTTAAKRPQLQTHGGDLRVFDLAGDATCSSGQKGFIRTAFSRIDGRYYGSWGEFGAMSACNNTRFTSGAKIHDSPPAVANTAATGSALHSLTFANSGVAGSEPYGRYANSSAMQSSQALTSCPANATVYASFAAFKTASDTNLDALEGVHCINAPTSFVTVDSNVRLDPSPSRISAIPQLIIIANNIRVRENVSHIDAWLVTRKSAGAGGDLFTCVNGSNARYTALSESRCDRQLVVNGPVVVAGNLLADRTYGGIGNDDKSKAAEVFNLPASTVLWWYYNNQSNARIDTVSIKEMPPRY